MTTGQTMFRLVLGLIKIAVLAFRLNASVNQLEEQINQYIMQIALSTGNMFYVYMVMITGFIVLTAVGLVYVLKHDVERSFITPTKNVLRSKRVNRIR